MEERIFEVHKQEIIHGSTEASRNYMKYMRQKYDELTDQYISMEKVSKEFEDNFHDIPVKKLTQVLWKPKVKK